MKKWMYALIGGVAFVGMVGSHAACNLADGTQVTKRDGDFYSHASDAALPGNEESDTTGSYVEILYLNGFIHVKRMSVYHYYEEQVGYDETTRSSCGGGGGISLLQKAGGLDISIKNDLTLFGIIKVQYNGFGSATLIENASVNLETGLRARYALDDIYANVIYVGDYYYQRIDGNLVFGGIKSNQVDEFVKGSFLRYKEICCQECVEGLAH